MKEIRDFLWTNYREKKGKSMKTKKVEEGEGGGEEEEFCNVIWGGRLTDIL